MNLRLIAWHAGENITLLHVNHHDAAYRWAERTRAVSDSAGQILALTPLHVETDEGPPLPQKDTAARHLAEQYLLLGMSAPVARLLASVADEGEWLEVVGQLAPAIQEQALSVRCGVLSTATQTLPSDIVLLQDEEAIRFALRLPTELWRVFLHPQQRFAVDMPPDRHVLLRGGPGVGKSVTLVHRFVRMAQSGVRPPLLLALNQPARRVLQESLDALDCGTLGTSLVTVGDIPRGKSGLAGFLRQFSSVLVDEGQDLPRGFLANILAIMDDDFKSVPSLFIAYDANQALSSPSGSALERLASFCDTVRLTYSYRCTAQNAEASLRLLSSLHSRFIGKDFKNSHEISASRDPLAASYVSATSGPDIVSKMVTGDSDTCARVVAALTAFDRCYAAGCSKAVIIVSEGEEVGATRSLIEDELIRQGLEAEVLTPAEAKGREFFAGVLIDRLTYTPLGPTDGNGTSPVTEARYRQLSGLYVGLSRFRDRVVCLYDSTRSPLHGLRDKTGMEEKHGK